MILFVAIFYQNEPKLSSLAQTNAILTFKCKQLFLRSFLSIIFHRVIGIYYIRRNKKNQWAFITTNSADSPYGPLQGLLDPFQFGGELVSQARQWTKSKLLMPTPSPLPPRKVMV